MSSRLDQRNFTKYLSRFEIEAAVQSLGHRITEDYQGKELALIANLKGSYAFASDLIRQIDPDKVSVEIDFVRLTGQGKAKGKTGTISLLKDISLDIKGKHVLLVVEILDSARTLRFLYDRIQGSEPRSVEIVTLLDKVAKRAVELPVKYFGKKIDDQFLVGYGMDLEEKHRNLPDIYYLRYPN